MENQSQRQKAQWVKSLGLLSVILVDLVGYTGAGVAIGYLAWKKAGAPWWVLLLTSSAGLGLAMYQMYRMSIKLDGKESDGS